MPKIQSYFEEELFTYLHKEIHASGNEYVPVTHFQEVTSLYCNGYGIRHPWFYVLNTSMVMDVKMTKDYMNVTGYCDNVNQYRQIDPYPHFENETNKKEMMD